MTEADDDTVELSEEELQAMVDEAIDIIAMTLPENAGDDYWRQLRSTVERRSQELLLEDEEDQDD